MGARWETAEILTELNWAVGFMGDADQSARLDLEVLDFHRTLGDQRGIAHSLHNVATNLTSRGQYKEAERLNCESLALCREENVAGRHVAAAAEALPPDVVAAARERGWARDLWMTVVELRDEFASTEDEDRV